MRSRIRRVGTTSRALVYAIIVHVIAAVVLVLNLELPVHIFSAPTSEPAPVQASVVSEKEIQAQEEAIKKKDEARKQKQLEAKKQLDELLNRKKQEEQKLAEINKRKEDEEKQARELKKKKEQERQQLAKLQQQQEARKKAAAEAKKKQEEARKKQEEARKKQEAARKKQEAAEEQRKKDLQAELAKEQLQKRVDAALARYIPMIRQKVSRNWNLPDGVQDNIEVHVNVRLSPDGQVLSAQIVKSSGNPVFDRSVENAVLKASPLPIPTEQGVNEEFRNLTLTFKPEELVS